ncbi:hypothetical protein N431DRAFT_481457 [Stipitochalara longipes BDJ]|nr:hypothetical protein N431DRAFT_481457 [Stipitochalara longipes BDJ]
MRSSTILLKATGLSVLASTVFATPVDIIPVSTPESLSDILTIRQSGSGGDPTDFLVEEVTASFDGNPPFTFTQFDGLNITEDDKDYIFELSTSLLADLRALRANPDICIDNTTDSSAKKIRDTNESAQLSKRQTISLDGNTWTIGEETECWSRWTIDGIAPGQGGLGQLVPINAQAQRVADYVENGVVSDMTKRLIAFIQNRGYLGWLQPDQVRMLAQASAGVNVAIEQNAIVDGKFRISKANFGLNTTRTCGTGINMPLCQDANCRGANRTCSPNSANNGCACAPLALQFAPVNVDFDALDAQQNAFNLATQGAVDGVSPQCNGIGTQAYTTRDTVVNNINQFCRYDLSGSVTEVYNFLSLALNFTGDPFTIGSDQCSDLLTKIVDGCDGNNPDNPYNWKHGGSIQHPAGATLTFTPKGGAPQPFCIPESTGFWIDEASALTMASGFCDNNPSWLVGKAGDRHTVTYNSGSDRQVTVSMLYTKDLTLDKNTCYNYMEVPVTGCNGNQANNPNDNKFGGIYTSPDGVVIQFVPQKSPAVYPPNNHDANGNPIVPVCTSSMATPGPPSSSLSTFTNKLCIDGGLMGVHSYEWDSGTIFTQENFAIFTVNVVNATLSYQGGASVCEPNGPWNGKTLIGDDCKTAVNAMVGACYKKSFYPSTYTYNCVNYSFKTFTHG